jgi:TAT (twin-arginine translocation) pathway signal sequence
MTVITNLSRRDLLKGAAATSGLVLGFHVGFRKLPFAQAAEALPFQPYVFLSVDDRGHRACCGRQ